MMLLLCVHRPSTIVEVRPIFHLSGRTKLSKEILGTSSSPLSCLIILCGKFLPLAFTQVTAPCSERGVCVSSREFFVLQMTHGRAWKRWEDGGEGEGERWGVRGVREKGPHCETQSPFSSFIRLNHILLLRSHLLTPAHAASHAASVPNGPTFSTSVTSCRESPDGPGRPPPLSITSGRVSQDDLCRTSSL